MARKVALALAPARGRSGVSVVPDGSRERPLLLHLPGDGASCNNGCSECLTLPVSGEEGSFDAEVRDKHVVLRDREPTLRRDLPTHVAALRARGAESITLVTNGRLLAYDVLTRGLVRAGVSRFVVKLFGVDAASHDAITRAPDSFAQACAGIAAARAAGAEALACFPLCPGRPGETERALAASLTGREPVRLPEPVVETHANEFRFDLVDLQRGVAHPWWTRTFFPMVHVHTGPVCNVRCTYCNVHGGDDQRVYTREYIEQMIDRAAPLVLGTESARAGVPTLDLIGGEPTLHPDLAALIRRGRQAGFPQVFICTNGVLLLRPGYLDSLIAAGLTGVRFSFHHHEGAAAAALADVGGLGDRYPEVAKMLLGRSDLHVHLYRIVLSSTIDALPDYLRFLAAHNRTGKPLDLTLGMPSMRGRLFENRHLYPPLGSLRDKLLEAITLARSLGIEPLIHHAPSCLVPDAPARSSWLHIETRQVDALASSALAAGSAAADDQVPGATVADFEGDARYGAACERCDGRRRGCHGVPAAYWEQDAAATEAWLRPLALPEEEWPAWR